MTDAIEMSRRLYFAVDGINQVLRSIDPNWQVLYDLTLKKVEVLKDRKFEQGFDFTVCKNLKEWGEKEHAMFEYFGALIVEIVKEQQKDLNGEN